MDKEVKELLCNMLLFNFIVVGYSIIHYIGVFK